MAETLFVLYIWALISVFKRLFCEEYSKYSLHINIALMLLHCEEGCEINFTMQVWASEFILFNPGSLKHSLYAALFQSLKSPLKLWRQAFSNLRCYGKKRTPKRKGECGGINLCFGYVLLDAYHCLPFFFVIFLGSFYGCFELVFLNCVIHKHCVRYVHGLLFMFFHSHKTFYDPYQIQHTTVSGKGQLYS